MLVSVIKNAISRNKNVGSILRGRVENQTLSTPTFPRLRCNLLYSKAGAGIQSGP